MAVAKRNLEEIGESLENMGMNDRPSLLNTEMAKSEEDKNISKGGRKRKSYWTAEEGMDGYNRNLKRKNSFS